ncbi:hypothetical protein ACH4FE_35615 [Streptomyces celluloflavus]|uniref:hypothetical protein n=1 Tax=Streptomyces celluloflavus TaxID=58344 RepID=UPI0037924FA3
MGERETWTTEEFGSSHEGAVGVLLADGTVPEPVSQWSVYDGHAAYVPRAAALRAVCSCGWAGPEHTLDWEAIGDQELVEAGAHAADACMEKWDEHTAEVEQSTVPLPEAVTALLRQLEEQIEKLAKDSPLAAVRAARRLEVTAVQVAYWPAHDARRDASIEQVAAALGLNEGATRGLMARFGRWSPYR